MAEIEPDAWRYEKYCKMKTDSLTRHAPKDPAEWIDQVDISIVPESVEPLYSAETIQEVIDELMEKHEESHEKVRECDVEACEYDSSEREHADQEFMIVGRKQALRELKEVFSE